MIKPKKVEKPASRLPLGLLIAGVGTAAALLVGLGIGLALVFKSRGAGEPQSLAAVKAAEGAVPGPAAPPPPVEQAPPPPAEQVPLRAANTTDRAGSDGASAVQAPGVANAPPSSHPETPAARPAAGQPDGASSSSGPIAGSAAAASAIVRAVQTTDAAVKMIQEATVFIKVQAGRLRGSGTGFVIQSEGDTVLIATNHHVAVPQIDGAPEADNHSRPGAGSVVTVVFRGGGGPGVEQSLRAEVIAADGDEGHDLAILQARGVKDPPGAIALSDAPEPTITMPVLIYGFPFGNLDEQLDPSVHRNPSITVNRGSVSSLKKDHFNRLARIQIDGSINPGNSGGPVVDEKGRLVGVAVAKINNTNIGFAIPGLELARMLGGRLGPIRLGMRGESGGQADVQVEVSLIDPRKRIQSVDVLFAPAGKASAGAAPDAEGSWPPPGRRRNREPCPERHKRIGRLQNHGQVARRSPPARSGCLSACIGETPLHKPDALPGAESAHGARSRRHRAQIKPSRRNLLGSGTSDRRAQ
jgi:S1-C subfamily serine protease